MLQGLQNTTKVINSAFNNSFIKKLCQYLHDCVREEVKSSTFRNLKGDKDNKWIFLKGEETLFTKGEEYLKLEGSDNNLTNLMIQSENSQKDKYLIYGYLFLVGKSAKKRHNEFLTPLLYMPCHLERNGVNINCMLTDEFMSLNTGALTALMKKCDDEDEVEQLLDGLLDVVPSIPITQEKMDIFLTTLKSIFPDIDISLNPQDIEDKDNVSKDFYAEKTDSENIDELIEEEEETKKQAIKLEKISLTRQCAIILTKRPAVTAGVLHELTQIAEQPSGTYRETSLSVINEEYSQSKNKSFEETCELKDFIALTPLSLSDAQEQVIKNIETNRLVSVYGPPGTGKSQTIVNLVAHLIASGKSVLVASKMDKAVDVVADRLNGLGASYLALRAGRLNYQRELSFQLQELISKKASIDEDVEDILFANVNDMKKLIKTITEAENKCENIIKLEKEWTEINETRLKKDLFLGERFFIRQVLKKNEIEELEKAINTIEKNQSESGLFASILNHSSNRTVKKILQINNLSLDDTNITTLKNELDVAKLETKCRTIENEIQKIGNLHLLIDEIHDLKLKRYDLAVNVLKNQRRETIKELLQNQTKRQRLFIHSKSLIERKKNLQNRLLESEDFKPLLEAFPCWCVTTYAVSGSLPMKPALFDVAIIDEASQCDIASCFPIMYRAKRTVIVGDDKQLPHLSFLEKAKEQSFLSQYGIPDKYQLMWRFRSNSMFDVANYYSLNPVLLDEHFRCLPPIIDFSNKEFYADRIKIMRQNSSEEKVLELIEVPDGKVDLDATRNLIEVEAVVKKLHELIIEDERKSPEKPLTIGIVSPFRAQVEQLKLSVSKVISDHMLKKHEVEIGTAHTFQGDEKDVILASWTFASNSFPQSITFLQKPNLFNVAITRAKNKMINFVSKDVTTLPEGLFRNYVSYIKEYENKREAVLNNQIDENEYKNELEKEIAKELRTLKHNVKAGVIIAGLSADLLIDEKFIVEIDGVEDKIKSHTKNMKKQAIMERSGFKVKRITSREWQYSKKACLERILL